MTRIRRHQILTTFLMIMTAFTWMVSSDCVIYDDPRYLGLYVSCPNNDLEHVPGNLPYNTSSLDLSRNYIRTVKNYSLSSLPFLKYLDLSHNVLTNLEPMAFHHCHLLQHLDISYNKLSLKKESFPDIVFDSIYNLRWLNMKHNQHGDGCYPERIFHHLGKLEVLLIGAYGNQVFGSGFRFLSDLKELYIGDGDCDLSGLYNHTFIELTNSSLQTLEISLCGTSVMEAGTLEPLTKLIELHMEFLQLGTERTLKALVPLEGRRMKTIELKQIRFPDKPSIPETQNINDRIVNSHLLKPLSRICVTEFIISQNQLFWLDWMYLADKTFASCVEKIDASSNMFTNNFLNIWLGFVSFSKLTILDLSIPEMALLTPETYPKYTLGKNRPLLAKESMDINSINNWIECLHTICNISLPPNIASINISAFTNHHGHVKGMYHIVNGGNVVHFNFSFLGLTDIETTITGLHNLKVFDLSGNPNLHFINFGILSGVVELEDLLLSYSSFQQSAVTEQGEKLLKHVPNLKRLYLRYNQLYLLPTSMFSFNSKLELLDLSGNLFTSIPFDLELLPCMNVLDLSFNTIITLNRKDRHSVDSFAKYSKKLYLNRNLFSCGCDSLDFLLWLKETFANFDNGKDYVCLEGKDGISSTGAKLKEFLEMWRKCHGVTLFYITVLLSTIIVASLLGALLVRTNKTTIIYMFLNNLKKQLRKPKRADFKWDVYIAYAEADYRWVVHSLRPRLEEKGLTLYVYDRDSTPGESIPDQIAESISQSWKTILYFTRNYQTDQWSYVSMMATINRVDSLNPERIILLLPEEEHPRIPNCLLEVVPETCIFQVETAIEGLDQLSEDIAVLVKK